MNTYTQMSTRGQSLMPDRCTHARRRKITHANTQTLSYTHTHTYAAIGWQFDMYCYIVAREATAVEECFIMWQGKRLQ